jgi:hypothetical protein
MVDVKVTSSEQHRRPLAVAACTGAIGLLYVAYLGQSRSLGTDADGASNVLQADAGAGLDLHIDETVAPGTLPRLIAVAEAGFGSLPVMWPGSACRAR